MSSTFSSGSVGGDGSNILDSSNSDSISGNGSEGRLGAWAWSLVVGSSSASKSNVYGVEFQLFKSVDDIDCGEHSGIG